MIMVGDRTTGPLPGRYRRGARAVPDCPAVCHAADMSQLSVAGLATAAGRAPEPPAVSSPVFVLTGSRCGSTLLRIILDSHPDLACPPETGISSACGQLARAWDVLDNADSTGADEPAGSSPDALAAVRDSLDRLPATAGKAAVVR